MSGFSKQDPNLTHQGRLKPQKASFNKIKLKCKEETQDKEKEKKRQAGTNQKPEENYKEIRTNSKETGNKTRNTDEAQEWETDVDNQTTKGGKTH